VIGLWRFHRCAHDVLKRSGFRWWIPEEENRVYRIVSITNFGTWSTYTHADAVIRCANRYLRRIGKTCVTVKEWNSLCNAILNKGKFSHYATSRVCIFDGYRDRSPLRIDEDQYLRPRAGPTLWQITERLSRIKKWYEERCKRKCVLCGVKTYQAFLTPACGDLFSDLQRTYGYNFSTCFYHYMALSKLAKVANESEKTRLEIQRTKRKLHESAKINARIDGISVNHHGGSD
jgi:hypothetical protein